ncbi:SAM-dependent methyltransferase [Mycobacterium kubicae]|uniref:SAM-dependent methyltransferase n=1 Tax=Mycobacterium kubicae TaxID=120959 RepID=A0AAX1J9M7_9MYCO|nr:class I SAM-dependent methyltransferase [Mycobacterium kubicae]MCV7094220.1 class I SAM-dependent methyltransferase [Mycobacterium kubicae]OBF23252.1 SAM-dependent methyltransferase [Mycobacterium kubicae]ORV98887.1 SAM-dependent methyltransferase [Mycobacterium kubicae]QNI04969.1 class I SAM-dependent methyltransferase [Mycobacterium kubicae]QNI09966.1 class I SAM-dependent methyltransferase [Mycobacterium kubicae]
MTEAMEAEFDTVAEWTAQVAVDLGPDYYVPAGCRGSGSPAALDWLIDELGLTADETLLDSGAGVGGPAAYAAQAVGVTPLLVEPEAGACRAARTLFDYPVLQAIGSALPLADATFDAAWSLGVLCTTPDQRELLTELRRTVRPPGRVALLTFVARESVDAEQPEGNHFPTTDRLTELVEAAGLRVQSWRSTADLPDIPQEWTRRVDAVTDALAERHGRSQTWQLAERQSNRIGELLAQEKVTGELLVLRHA